METEAIEEVRKDYYIQVDMDEKLLDGKPQPPAFHEHMKLVLPSEDNQTPDTEAAQAEDAPIEVVGTWNDKTHTSCTWIVKADSFWKYTLKEYNYKPKSEAVKFSGWYNVRNSHEPVKVAEHKDIEDDGQTVLITERIIKINKPVFLKPCLIFFIYIPEYFLTTHSRVEIF